MTSGRLEASMSKIQTYAEEVLGEENPSLCMGDEL